MKGRARGGPATTAAKLATNERLSRYVQERLAGIVRTPAGEERPGPKGWIHCRHGPRKDRRRASAWSREQTTQHVKVDVPDDEGMRVSDQAQYVQGRGALRRELTTCLRTDRALRVSRERTRAQGRMLLHLPPMSGHRIEPRERSGPALAGHGVATA